MTSSKGRLPGYRVLGWPSVAAVALLLLCGVAKPPTAGTVHLPPGYDFQSALEGEELSVDDFTEAQTDAMKDSWPQTEYGQALAHQTLGLVREDPTEITVAKYHYASQLATAREASLQALCRLGMRYCDAILSGHFPTHGAEHDQLAPVIYQRWPAPTGAFHHIILGTSAIRLPRGALVKTQVDRVVRDWLQSFGVNNSPWAYAVKDSTTWHEGFLLRQLVDLAGARVAPVWGTRARLFGEKWYAPDARGVYRFEISEDKVINFPTSIVVDDHTAMLNDTHGISALAWNSLDANLVLGCGDHKGKMDAAYYLAAHGVNVYCPTDRVMGLLMGARTKGTIIGSAPIKKSGNSAVIGDQPLTIDVNEPIVVSTAAQKTYPLKYYDAAYTYFQDLQAYCGKHLHLIPVAVRVYGHSDVVVDEARRRGVLLMGIRVKSKLEHDAVAAWLKEDPKRRVVLFHTAAYPDGYRLFAEFPHQTSFGDIHPRFE